jgi:nitrogen fixation protein NifU and related proteins
MSSLYQKQIIEHSKNPHNTGVISNPTLEAYEVNTLCGDGIRMFLNINDSVITEVKFEGSGCAISQSSASMLTDELIGMKVDEAKKISKDDILEMMGLDNINPSRMRCALLSLETLRKALKNV